MFQDEKTIYQEIFRGKSPEENSLARFPRVFHSTQKVNTAPQVSPPPHTITSFTSKWNVQLIYTKEEFNKTIIPFALVGYEVVNSQLGASRLVGYLPPRIQRGLMK